VTPASPKIPHVGWMSILIDPTGAVIALFEPAPGGPPM
jgi:predicted enzyme related to lactoylglutathione lyase